MAAVRGTFLDFKDDPFYTARDEDAARWIADGLLVIGSDGKILDFGPYATLAPKYPGVKTTTYGPGILITPGLIDSHIHYVQSRVTAAYGLHKCAAALPRGRTRARPPSYRGKAGESARTLPPPPAITRQVPTAPARLPAAGRSGCRRTSSPRRSTARTANTRAPSQPSSST